MISHKIKELRKGRKLTQSDLAKILKVSVPTIAFWETNKRSPDISKLIEIAKYFNVSVDWLLGLEETRSSICVDNSANTITLIGRDGVFKSYILDDSKLKAFDLLAETLSLDNNEKFKKK